MAYLTKHPHSKYWTASFRDMLGRRVNRSTKIERAPGHEDPKERARLATKARRHALEVANEFEATARGDRSEAQIRKTLADLYRSANEGRTIEFHTCRAFLERWLDRASKAKAAGTITRYSGTIKNFLEILGAKADCHIGDISSDDIETYIAARSAGGRNLTTVSTDLKTLNVPFALALRQGQILTNPIAIADKQTAEKEAREPFTATDLQTLIAAATGEWKTAILLGGKQGLRLGDATGLKWSNIKFHEKIIRIVPGKTKKKKKVLKLPIHPEVEAHLLTLPTPDNAPDGYLCPNLAKAKPGGGNGLSRQFQKIMASTDIEQRTTAPQGEAGRAFNAFTFHSLRHHFVTALAAAGVDKDQRMLLAGHADEKTHSIYTHATIESLRTAIGKI